MLVACAKNGQSLEQMAMKSNWICIALIASTGVWVPGFCSATDNTGMRPPHDSTTKGLNRSNVVSPSTWTADGGSIPLLFPDPLLDWLIQLNVKDAWRYSYGNQVRIAVIDSGIYAAHPDFGGRIIVPQRNYYYDYLGARQLYFDELSDTSQSEEWDLHGHGTFVAGIIGGYGSNFIGVAPEAEILSVRAMNPSRLWLPTHSEQVIAGIYYAISQSARVINLSVAFNEADLDFAAFEDEFQTAVDQAYAQGVISVAGAGNSRADTDNFYPAGLRKVITVGGINTGTEDTWYNPSTGRGSNAGTAVDFVAPALNILSLRAQGAGHNLARPAPEGFDNELYGVLSGTSMSTAMVSGITAVMLADDPALTFSDIYRKLQYSSKDLGAPGRDDTFGHGLVDALGAISMDFYSNDDDFEDLNVYDGIVKTLKLPPTGTIDLPQGLVTITNQLGEYFQANDVSLFNFKSEYAFKPDDGKNYKAYGRPDRITYKDGSFDLVNYWHGSPLLQIPGEAEIPEAYRIHTLESYNAQGQLFRVVRFDENGHEISLVGDLDKDYRVDRTDVAIFAQRFGPLSGASRGYGDLDDDGDIDLMDMATLQTHLGESLGFNGVAPTAAVPEPASWPLAISGLGVLGGAAWRAAIRRRPTRSNRAAQVTERHKANEAGSGTT